MDNNPYYWVYDPPLSYENNGNLDPTRWPGSCYQWSDNPYITVVYVDANC